MRTGRWGPGAGLVAVALLLAGCGASDAKPEGVGDEAKEAPIPVEAAAAVQGTITAAWHGTATLEAEAEAEVVARVGGIVETIHVEEGDAVRAGDVLLELDRAELELEVARARAEVDRLAADHARSVAMRKKELISREAHDRIRYTLAAAEAALAQAELQLRHATVRAPITGTVTARHVKLGNLIERHQPVLHIARFTPLLAVVHVPERDLRRLAPGQPAELALDAWPERSFSGRVQRVSPVVDPETGTARVTIEVDAGQPELRPGMFARVRVIHDRREQATLIPGEALLTEDGRDAVFVVTGEGLAERRPVRVGYREDGRVEILDGLSPGERVVTTGQTALRDAARVEVVGAAAG